MPSISDSFLSVGGGSVLPSAQASTLSETPVAQKLQSWVAVCLGHTATLWAIRAAHRILPCGSLILMLEFTVALTPPLPCTEIRGKIGPEQGQSARPTEASSWG